MLDDDHNDLKCMYQMILYSKVYTIRDKQLDEAKQAQQEWVEEQKRIDLMVKREQLYSLKIQKMFEIERKFPRIKAFL